MGVKWTTMADSKLKNTELVKYKAVSGCMSDYFGFLNYVMTVQSILLKTFSVGFATNHSLIMDRTPCCNVSIMSAL